MKIGWEGRLGLKSELAFRWSVNQADYYTPKAAKLENGKLMLPAVR